MSAGTPPWIVVDYGGSEEDIETLFRSGLLLEKPAAQADDVIKVYIALKPFAGESAAMSLSKERVIEWAESFLKPREHQLSLYTGGGRLGDYLLKVVFDTFTELTEMTAQLDSLLDEHSWKPMTLIIADPSRPETDNLNSVHITGTRDAPIIDVVGLEYETAINALTDREITRLHALVERISSDYADANKTWDAGLRLLRASLVRNEEQMSEVFGRLILFEPRLRQYMASVWKQYMPKWYSTVTLEFGDSLADTVDAEMEADGADEPVGFAGWSIGNVVKAAEYLSSENEQINHRMVSDLGSSWLGRLKMANGLRNRAFHGRFVRFGSEYRLDGEWSNVIEDFVRTYELFELIAARLDAMSQRSTGS